MFFKTFLYCLTLLPLGVLAALDEKVKLANRTIDRVSRSTCCVGEGVAWKAGGSLPKDCDKTRILFRRSIAF